ncbi:unnamed protein product [Aphanomyces euteiches]
MSDVTGNTDGYYWMIIVFVLCLAGCAGYYVYKQKTARLEDGGRVLKMAVATHCQTIMSKAESSRNVPPLRLNPK